MLAGKKTSDGSIPGIFSTGWNRYYSAILLLSLCMVVSLMFIGCVAINEASPPYEELALTEGKCVLLLAFPPEQVKDQNMVVQIELVGLGSFFCRVNSLNRIIIPAGTYYFKIHRLPQDPDNLRTGFIFQSGQVKRVVLLPKNKTFPQEGGIDSATTAESTFFQVLPITKDGLRTLADEYQMKVVDVNLQPD